MCLVFVALVAGTLTVTTITLSFVLVGMCCAYQILAIYKVSTYVPDNLAGLTTAIANMIIMTFGYGFHTVIGVVVNAYGGIRDANAFIYGIGVIPITLALGVTGILVLAYQDKFGTRRSAIKERLSKA